MARPKKVVEETINEKVNIKETIEATEYSVYNGSSLVRVYTVEEHGEQAKELAKSFANKNNYQIK